MTFRSDTQTLTNKTIQGSVKAPLFKPKQMNKFFSILDPLGNLLLWILLISQIHIDGKENWGLQEFFHNLVMLAVAIVWQISLDNKNKTEK